MSEYRNASVCENGHVLSETETIENEFCPTCGKKILTHCSNCNALIRGKKIIQGVLTCSSKPPIAPAYCFNCGNPFPWTVKALQAAELIIKEDDSIPTELKNNAIESLPDLVTKNPKTDLAIIRFKKVFGIIGNVALECLEKVITSIACEYVKQNLGI